MYEHLGEKVLCKAYYKKVNDGVHIVCFDKDGMECEVSHNPKETAYAYNQQGTGTKLSFEGDGIEKQLRELIEKRFTGVCVGETVIPITEYLYADTGYHYNGEEFGFIGKQILQTCECYIVYYANNKKRYVPKDYCEFMKGGA